MNELFNQIATQVKATAQGDMTDPRVQRKLRQQLDLLPKLQKAFMDTEQEAEAVFMDEAPVLGIDEFVGAPGYDMAVPAIPLPPLGPPQRRQKPNVAETFISRLARESLSWVPKFLEQGRIAVEARRAAQVVEIAHAIDRAEQRGDLRTIELLKTSLASLVADQGTKVKLEEIIVEALKNVNTASGPTGIASNLFVGLASFAGSSGLGVDLIQQSVQAESHPSGEAKPVEAIVDTVA